MMKQTKNLGYSDSPMEYGDGERGTGGMTRQFRNFKTCGKGSVVQSPFCFSNIKLNITLMYILHFALLKESRCHMDGRIYKSVE